jgi:hypothetical protein
MKRKKKPEAPPQTFAQKYATWIVVAVLVALIAPGTYFVVTSLWTGQSQSRETAPFEKHIDDYLTAPKTGGTGTSQKARGKIVPVDVQERHVDRLYFELPKELRAASPDDVATVVWLAWREEKVGEYDGGKPACIERCDVTVIDRQQNAVVAKKEFRGGEPPKTLKSNFTKGVGPRPYKEIADYLVSLCGS